MPHGKDSKGFLFINRKISQMFCSQITPKEGRLMQSFINEKEVSALIRALELLLKDGTQRSEAEKLLSRIETCLEKQGKPKRKS